MSKDVGVELRHAAFECPAGLDTSPACLGSYKCSCIGSIGTRPIGHETKHIMAQLWCRNPAQKTKPS